MTILLVAINSKYNHTNIAVRSIARYCENDCIAFSEFTINMSETEILRGILKDAPKLILFSTYIWNIQIIETLISDIKKISPDVVIGAGGPETGFAAEKYLKNNSALDFIVKGEGEKTVKEICHKFMENPLPVFFKSLKNIKGIFLQSENEIVFTGERELISNLDELYFPYEKITEPDNKIFYYESSRGCPFACAYCMSSLDKRVRFLSLERVFRDIQIFLDAKVSLVKFVDRTYNINEERYLKIWEYIISHHNKKTMFHFEIEAEFLSEHALEFLQKVPDGVMQFEIGIQSANPKTLSEVCRSGEIIKLADNIKKIPKTIHKHLDLIAGLPYEDLESFGKSYEFVMSLEPDEIQLGFLKILHGTKMESYAQTNGWKWMTKPPYETFSTPYLNYEKILFLKDVEQLTDVFFNSGNFDTVKKYIGQTIGFWNFIKTISERARENGCLDAERKIDFWFEFLATEIGRGYFSGEVFDKEIFLELLKFDFLRQKKHGNFPAWFCHNYDKEKHLELMKEYEKENGQHIEFKFSDYDKFMIDPTAKIFEKSESGFEILFIYNQQNKIFKIPKSIT